jgi:hypothetical protein
MGNINDYENSLINNLIQLKNNMEPMKMQIS